MSQPEPQAQAPLTAPTRNNVTESQTPGPVTRTHPRGCDLGPGSPHRRQRPRVCVEGVAWTYRPRPGDPQDKTHARESEYVRTLFASDEDPGGPSADDEQTRPLGHPCPGDFDGPPAD